MIAPKPSELTNEELLNAIKIQEDFIRNINSEDWREKEGVYGEEWFYFEESAVRQLVPLLRERVRRIKEEEDLRNSSKRDSLTYET